MEHEFSYFDNVSGKEKVNFFPVLFFALKTVKADTEAYGCA